jgi:glyoxylase-like metal-dependent hydrolase (beta-lactamase superfamily II)
MHRFVVAFLACGLVLSVAGSGAKAEQHLLMSQQVAPDFRLEEIAPNIYAFVSNNTTRSCEDGNTTVIITDEGVVVVDAPSTYLSEQHLAAIRKLTNKPVVYLIDTHFHPDHVFGNHVYKDAFPGLHIIVQDYTKMEADRRNPYVLAHYQGPIGKVVLESLRKQAETGIDLATSKPLQGYDAVHAKIDYAECTPHLAAAERTRLVSADMTYSENLTLTLGGAVIKLMHFEGHTVGDTVVYLPQRNILITGDLVIGPVPYGGDDVTEKWIGSLETLMAMHASVIVPGHGEVEFDNGYMQLEHDLLSSLMAQAYVAATRDDSSEQFKKTLDLSSFKSKIVGSDPDKDWTWRNFFIGVAADRAFDIARGAVGG